MLALPHMKSRGGGSIIYITSTMGFFASPFIGYTVVKAALHHLIHDQALLFGKSNVRVNGIAPGPVLWAEHDLDDGMKRDIVSRTALKREGSPQDIARTALFLIRDAPYITGQIIAVDGQPVTSELEAMWAVQQRHPGDDIQLQIERGGEKRIVHLTGD